MFLSASSQILGTYNSIIVAWVRRLAPVYMLELAVSRSVTAGSPYAATDITMDHVRQLYETNVFGVMAMVKEFVPLLIASQDGCVVNIGSLSAIAPVPFTCVYGSSKAALHSYTDVLRVELAPFK